MRKTLLSIVLLSLLAGGCSNSNRNFFEKISKDRKFNIENYKAYVTNIHNDKTDDVAYISYDLNNNDITDAVAITKILEVDSNKYVLNPFAFAVSVDENEDKTYDKYYFDKDGDGKFDMIIAKKSNEEKKDNSVSL
jgi:hypothetical protein